MGMKWGKLSRRAHRLNGHLPGWRWPAAHTRPSAVGVLGDSENLGPARRLPVAAGTFVIAFSLPVFVLAGWRLDGWLLGAVLWLGSQALGVLFDSKQIQQQG